MKALAVVAHHDDHLLWMGGVIDRLAARGCEWTLVAMCQNNEEWRHKFFDLCCTRWRVRGINLDFLTNQADHGATFPLGGNDLDQMVNALTGAVNCVDYDYVFTHSRQPNGEYGNHTNHGEAREVVDVLVRRGCFRAAPIHFAYGACWGPGTPTCAPFPGTDPQRGKFYVSLQYRELLRKCRLCCKIPDDLGGLSYPCPHPEAFETDGTIPDEMNAVGPY